ncbi:hypothetical protein Bca52824_077196 [Brassica carinata]|uniref:Uncharacterized protein n=1 Tax=Brassica carinata TaxID=52824 RepID=A0A8X7PV89_BRACI|nr:hypothetical protein Bca52824_077196 [Brassica carinata]
MSLSLKGFLLQGGKYVGFGSGSGPVPRRNQQDDVFSAVSQGFGRLSMVAASAASVVQTGTKEFTSKVKEGGYDHKVSETVNVVASKTTEIGQRTWGIMKGVMAIASQKVGEYTKEGRTTTWSQRNESESNGYYQNFGNGNKAANPSVEGRGSQSSSSGYYNNSQRSNSWDESKKKEAVASKGHQLLMMMMAGPVGMIPKMMFITKVPETRNQLVTTGNQTPLGLVEVFTKGDSECR